MNQAICEGTVSSHREEKGDLEAKGLAGRASVGSQGSSSPPPAAQAVDAAEQRRTGAVAVHPAANSNSGSNAGQRW